MFKNGLLSPDMIASFMNRYEFLSRYSALITENPNVGVITASSFLGELVDTSLSLQQDHVCVKRVGDRKRSSAHGDYHCLRNLYSQTVQEEQRYASQMICWVNKQESEWEESRNETYTWGHRHTALFCQALH